MRGKITQKPDDQWKGQIWKAVMLKKTDVIVDPKLDTSLQYTFLQPSLYK